MQERGWTPSEVDDLDLDEWNRVLAYEAVRYYEVTGEMPGVATPSGGGS
jgi:hypothetical protein